MEPQDSCDGKHSDTMIKSFKALLSNRQDAIHCLTIFNATREVINQESGNMTYISDEQLQTMQLCCNHDNNGPGKCFHGECIPPSYRCARH
jgi:hypothetical protein